MIILHHGLIKGTRDKIIGYVMVEKEKEYITSIIDEKKYEVEAVEPWLKGTDIKKINITDVNYGKQGQINWHPLSLYFPEKGILIKQFNNLGAYYLEDLQLWTDKEFRHLRRLGNITQRKIQELLLELELNYCGTDLINKEDNFE